MKRSQPKDYWCIAQKSGPTLYFYGHDLVSRADYVHAVGAADFRAAAARGAGRQDSVNAYAASTALRSF